MPMRKIPLMTSSMRTKPDKSASPAPTRGTMYSSITGFRKYVPAIVAPALSRINSATRTSFHLLPDI